MCLGFTFYHLFTILLLKSSKRSLATWFSSSGHLAGEVLKLQNLQVTSRRYAMHPLQSQISVDMAGGRAFIDRMGDVGHNCELGVSRLDTALESLMSKATNLQLVGLVHEGGMVLRNWRMEAAGEFAPTKRGQICGWTM